MAAVPGGTPRWVVTAAVLGRPLADTWHRLAASLPWRLSLCSPHSRSSICEKQLRRGPSQGSVEKRGGAPPFFWGASAEYRVAASKALPIAAEQAPTWLMEGSSKTEVIQPDKELSRDSSTKDATPLRRPFLIGVAGGTASGKTSVCRKIMEQLEEHSRGHLFSLSQDSFYRDLTPKEQEHIETYNFDHPDAFDFVELLQVLEKLKNGESVEIPNYDYVTSARLPYRTPITGATVVLLEGILVFHLPEIRELFDLKVFVDTDADTRLARRIRRDIVERGRDVMQVLGRYEQSVKPSFETYISPTKKFADIIVPRGAENTAALNLITQHIRTLLEQQGAK